MNTRSNAALAQALGNLAVEMHTQDDLEAILHTIVAAAAKIVPGISWAGIALVRNKRVTPAAPTDHVARALDSLQSELGEGPAIDALANHGTVVVGDLSVAGHWPRFASAATARGVQCLVSFRLFVDGDNLGALTLYGPEPHMFDDDSIVTGEILAQHAAVAMAGAKAEEQLQRAIASRDLIGQAKGILMHRDGLTALQAFAVLTKASQDTNVKLVDVAQFLVTEFEKRLG